MVLTKRMSCLHWMTKIDCNAGWEVVPFYRTKEEYHCNGEFDPHYYKHKVTKEIYDVCYWSEGLMSKKDIKRTRDNLKGRYVLRICRICVEAGLPASINSMSRVNQKSKGKEA